ncbi:hypothetical protein [Gordonia malaquae]|uniref:hypothetical protein n=1 Tax=Gordonia malaquae TaxID=410332 RepID=UPI0030FEC924
MPVIEALAHVLDVPLSELRTAAGLPAGERLPYTPPPEADLLSRSQRTALDALIKSIVEPQGATNDQPADQPADDTTDPAAATGTQGTEDQKTRGFVTHVPGSGKTSSILGDVGRRLTGIRQQGLTVWMGTGIDLAEKYLALPESTQGDVADAWRTATRGDAPDPDQISRIQDALDIVLFSTPHSEDTHGLGVNVEVDTDDWATMLDYRDRGIAHVRALAVPPSERASSDDWAEYQRTQLPANDDPAAIAREHWLSFGIDPDVVDALLSSAEQFNRSATEYNYVLEHGGDFNAAVVRLVANIRIACGRILFVLENTSDLKALESLGDTYIPFVDEVWTVLANLNTSHESISSEQESVDNVREWVADVERQLRWSIRNAELAATYIASGESLSDYLDTIQTQQDLDYLEFAIRALTYANAFVELAQAPGVSLPSDVIEPAVQRISAAAKLLTHAPGRNDSIIETVTRLQAIAKAHYVPTDDAKEQIPAQVRKTLVSVSADSVDPSPTDLSERRSTREVGSDHSKVLRTLSKTRTASVSDLITDADRGQVDDEWMPEAARNRPKGFQPQDPDAYDNTIGEESQDPDDDPKRPSFEGFHRS